METRRPGLVIALLATGILQGCSIGMAFSGDEKLDLTALDKGTSRGKVLTVFGTPASTVETGTGRTDVFYKKQGDTRSAGRGAAYIVADALTLGLAEFLTAPIEAAATLSDNVAYVVEYDQHDKVIGSSVTNLGKSRRKLAINTAAAPTGESAASAANTSPAAVSPARSSSPAPAADLSMEVSTNEPVSRPRD